MAKVVSDEILKLKIIVNGDDAQKRVTDLEEANKKLSDSISSVKNEQKKLSIERKSEQQELRAVKLAIEDVTARINARSTASKQLDATLASLQRKEVELKQKTDQSTAAFAKNKNEIAELTTKIADNKAKIDAEIRSMDIMSLTSAQLNRRMNDLKFTMANMNPNTPAYKDAQADMQRLTGRMTELRTGANGSANSIGALADKFNRYQGIAVAATATLAGVSLSLQKVIDLNNKLADAQTTVSKTTGMNKEEVDELTKSFAEFNTRTARMDLLKISEIGGRLGVPKDEIKDFTKEVDKAFVALGDGFTGGVEAVANKLGKIKGLFKETKDLQIADAMNQVGSAMNELGAAGAASEENIAEFALRVGSLPDVLKPTIGDALALGAAFEESGIDAERSGTAYTNFISIAAKNTKAFSEVMRIPQQQVKDMINSNPTEFFLQFAQGLKGMDATDLAKTLEYLKLNDQYVKGILGSASENTDKFRASMDLSNRSLQEATSLQNEFNKVNNNSAAVFDKVRKAFLGMFTSETVVKTLNWIISAFARLVGVNDEANESVSGFRRTLSDLFALIIIGTVAFFSITAAVALYNSFIKTSAINTAALEIIEKARNARMIISASLQSIWNAAVALGAITISGLTRVLGLSKIATDMQTVAQVRWNAAMAANPIGAIIALVTILAGAIYILKKRHEENMLAEKQAYEASHRYQTMQKENYQKGKDAVEQYQESVDNLIDVLKSEVSTQDLRKKAYERLIQIHPEFIGTVDKEYRATAQLASIYQELANQIEISARAKARAVAKQSIYDQIEADRIAFIRGAAAREKEQQERDALRKKYNYDKDRGNSAVKMFGSFEENNKGVGLQNRINENTALINQVNKIDRDRISEIQRLLLKATGAVKKQLEAELSALLNLPAEAANDKSNYKIPGGGSGEKTQNAKKTQAERDAEAALKAFQKAQEDLLNAGKEYDEQFLEQESDLRSAKIELMENGQKKELAMLDEQLYKERLSINKNINTKEKYDHIDDIIKRSSGKTKIALEKVREDMLKKDAYWNSREIIAIEKSEILKRTVEEKYQTLDFKKKEENFQKELELLERQKNEEIASYETLEDLKKGLKGRMNDEEIAKIKTWAEGKEALNKIYQQRELTMQIAHMEVMIAMYESLDLSILSKDQQDQVLKFIDDAKNGLAKLKATAKGKEEPDEKKELSLGQNTQTDILGMSPDNWVNFFKNLDNSTIGVQTVSAAIGALQQASALYYQFVEANEKRQLQSYERATDKKKQALKTQLQAGYINQETYKKLNLEADLELDKKKAELELNAAKRQKMMAISQVITSTALGIMNIWATQGINPIMAGILTGVVGVLGAVQLATIIAQPLPTAPGAEDGFYPTIRQQDGKLFNARRKRSSTGIYNEPTMLVGEGGASMPELVVSGRDLKRINPTIQRQYMQEISRVRGFEDGLYPTTPTSSGNDEIMIEMMGLIRTNIDVLNEIKLYGIKAYFEKNAQNGKDIDEMRQEYLDLKNRNKH